MTMPRLSMPTGPQITPKTLRSRGTGGQQNPTYLEVRRPTAPAAPMTPNAPMPAYPGQQTQPMITPPGGGQRPPAQPQLTPGPMAVRPPSMAAVPNGYPVTPKAKTPPQAGGRGLGDVYRFFASDLENQKNQALADTRSSAASRGVFYGTPLTGSEADINTQYLRGLGQLQAGMYGNEQNNELARLSLAAQLSQGGTAPTAPGNIDWSALGMAFGPQGTGTHGTPAPVAGPRAGPAITPNPRNPNRPPVGGKPLDDEENPWTRGY